ncbi:MAG: SIR2 family protein [Candidatus Lokiarchaeota archaeon]|nr:SIR2 family protein [Candidatus Lokiarchaeota archaeon]
MKEFFARDIDLIKYNELLENIRKDECVVFTGAGLSRPLGYRDWEDGILNGTKDNQSLTQLARFRKGLNKDKKLPEIVDECKKKLKEEYYSFLENEFGRKGKDKHHINLFYLWKANFQHYLTTNFDATLYDCREECSDEIFTYPNEFEIHKKRALYHLHGRAYLQDDNDTSPLKYYLEELVYGAEAYTKAYDENGNGLIENFIKDIIKMYSILFVGFSTNDEKFLDMFKKMNIRWEQAIDILNRNPKREKVKKRRHYILLNYPYKKIISNVYEDENENIYDEDIKKFKEKETELKKINIDIIAYKNEENSHINLEKILEDIKIKAPWKIIKTYEHGLKSFDSSSAENNEVIK